MIQRPRVAHCQPILALVARNTALVCRASRRQLSIFGSPSGLREHSAPPVGQSRAEVAGPTKSRNRRGRAKDFWMPAEAGGQTQVCRARGPNEQRLALHHLLHRHRRSRAFRRRQPRARQGLRRVLGAGPGAHVHLAGHSRARHRRHPTVTASPSPICPPLRTAGLQWPQSAG